MFKHLVDVPEIIINDFDEAAAIKFREAFYKQAAIDHSLPILIYIDSYGGEIDSLTHMLDVMDSVPNNVITACIGKAMSCGAVLLSHGDQRFVAPNARVMIHQASGGMRGTTNEIKTTLVELDRINAEMIKLLAKNTGKSVKAIKAIFDKNLDKYLTPKEVIKLGIADSIGVPKLVQQTQFVIGV
jgi:ATP-dependent Clp protease protease subunit